ncbi:meprin A subunit alpha-like [Ylistrum balloti]|uniref:meprin A subunit alpha-like n=1 Tax=Ylistrum balloti TaxID=509963 RepID=UPI00290591D6|nr:meprin A subunit alpha-like [Ylistrum balloti]
MDIRLILILALTSCCLAVPQRQKRNILTDKSRLWPFGVVPVVFDKSIDGFTLEKILASMQEIQMSTFSGTRACLSFVPRKNEDNYALFTVVPGVYGDGQPGMSGGAQTIHLYPNMAKADIMQVLVYTLGFYNEFRRPDRDNYVTVNMDNIDEKDQKFFTVGNATTFFNYPFDFESITFFYPYAYAKDPSKPTIQARYESQVFPWKVSLSNYDVSNLQRIYECGTDTSNRLDLLSGMISKCTFEFNFCEWEQDTTDDFDLERHMGPSSSGDTGPQADFSSGIGYYALASARNNHNSATRLISPELPAGDYCMRFHYYMYGSDTRKARLVRRMSGNDEVLAEIEGNQGNLWHRYSESISSPDSFKFVLEAMTGGSDLGDIAIDDVYILRGQCLV